MWQQIFSRSSRKNLRVASSLPIPLQHTSGGLGGIVIIDAVRHVEQTPQCHLLFRLGEIIIMHYLERLRTEHMRGGRCGLCGRWFKKLARHHESYNPERCIYVCNTGRRNCHWKIHFQPWLLIDRHREKLLRVRHGYKKTITKDMIENYVPPGRRPAQLKVRRKIKRMRL